MTNPENAAQNTYEIAENTNKSQTSWNEVKTASKQVLEASSTTYSRNSRFGLIENGSWVTPSRFDELATEKPPLYEFTVPDGETYIVTGKERNAYSPGNDYTSAFATQFSEAGQGEDVAPEGIKITQGLGDFRDGQEQGIPLIFQNGDAKFGTFQDNQLSNVKSVKDGDWKFDPFTNDDFQYDITKFAVKREEGNLYGSGSQRLYFKLRDINSKEEKYIEIAETGDSDDPVIDVFNLFNQVKVENNSGSPFTFSIGPLQFFNEGPEIPTRNKTSTKRDIAVNDDFTSTAGTVIGVYRKNPDNIEVPITAKVAGKANTDGQVDLVEVHPDNLSYPGVDPNTESNWTAPEGLRQRETGLQELDFTIGDVTIDTDSEGRKGEQVSAVRYDGDSTRGGESEPQKADESEQLNEFNYFAAVAQHRDTAVNITRFDIITEEAW